MSAITDCSIFVQWPYTYDACDVGTMSNQTLNGLPVAATQDNDPGNGGALSFLEGQRLSRCTCPGESHPGPVHQDGTYVGRAAPEIDMFEAQVCTCVSASNLLLKLVMRVGFRWPQRQGGCGLTIRPVGGTSI